MGDMEVTDNQGELSKISHDKLTGKINSEAAVKKRRTTTRDRGDSSY
jgi:hypothetical protein